MKIDHICDLSPTANNQRNSEGAFIELKDGRLLFVYSRYSDAGFDDGATADLYGMLSVDGGNSFSIPFPVRTHEQAQADNVMSVSLMRMQNGDLGLFYLAKRDADQCLIYLTRSSDEGATWSDPVLCSDNTGYIVLANDRAIRTRSGRILLPSTRHQGISRINDEGKKILRDVKPGELIVYASDDDGFTWYALAQNITIPYSSGCTCGPQEPGILELANGKLWCFIRTDVGRQYECFSTDDGKTWSAPLPSRFTSAISPMNAKYLRDGRIFAVYNPIPIPSGCTQMVDGVWTGARNPLSYRIIEDDGQTFLPPQDIENDPRHGFCYAAIHETEDGILLAYCAGGVEDGACLNRLRITKLHLN